MGSNNLSMFFFDLKCLLCKNKISNRQIKITPIAKTIPRSFIMVNVHVHNMILKIVCLLNCLVVMTIAIEKAKTHAKAESTYTEE